MPFMIREFRDSKQAGESNQFDYKQVPSVAPGTKIYRGKFTKHVGYGGQYDADEVITWTPVDPSQIREEIYQGDPSNVQEF